MPSSPGGKTHAKGATSRLCNVRSLCPGHHTLGNESMNEWKNTKIHSLKVNPIDDYFIWRITMRKVRLVYSYSGLINLYRHVQRTWLTINYCEISINYCVFSVINLQLIPFIHNLNLKSTTSANSTISIRWWHWPPEAGIFYPSMGPALTCLPLCLRT